MSTTGVWPDGFVEANGIRIHYWRVGDGPPVVLSHGAADDGLCWTRTAAHLADRFDVVMLDARGHGVSDSGRGDYSPGARAADLVGAINALGLDRPVLGGHSMGAETSIHVAARHPGLARGVFLEDPPLLTPGQPLFGGRVGQRLGDPGRWMAWQLGAAARLPQPMALRLGRRLRPGAPDEDVVPWVEAKRRVDPDFVRAIARGDSFELTPVEMLAEIAVPVLLFRGDREAGAIISEELAARAEALCSRLRVVHLEGASHDIRRDRFTDYVAALDEFLTEVFTADT